ncbi:YneF family protein [Mycoplasma sp. 744]|uniref:YneF family protein n=1 Tax=unclassified Mycoplasma TaxID=2683645 RepID=UPI00211C4A62|nr:MULTISPECIES: YneF family protein [unclassified Mycoplasma]MEA4115383.1 YneF family protein [Mycoplasma sp. 744]UUM19387.1 YneF family protein [Mycoplasma sp. 1018B]
MNNGISLGGWIGIVIAAAIVFAIAGAMVAFVVAKKKFEKQIKENPPITEKMIRAMFLQMGRKASEKQIKDVMRSMTNAKYDKN